MKILTTVLFLAILRIAEAQTLLTISTDPQSPMPSLITSTNSELDVIETLVMDVTTQNDTVFLASMSGITGMASSGNATPTSVFIFDGSTLLSSASVTFGSPNSLRGQFTLAGINEVIPPDTVKYFTVRESFDGVDPIYTSEAVIFGTSGDFENSIEAFDLSSSKELSGSDMAGNAEGIIALQSGAVPEPSTTVLFSGIVVISMAFVLKKRKRVT